MRAALREGFERVVRGIISGQGGPAAQRAVILEQLRAEGSGGEGGREVAGGDVGRVLAGSRYAQIPISVGFPSARPGPWSLQFAALRYALRAWLLL